eukprot:TRINITY_DN3874_c0_g2_i1.p1 TRINITY_DN3874_c0_g2~~TRINITY_DN3874_c0_g2_i1.p1  ORF type:complete len:468 (-),score=110.18 TRINITY_DN3874_c0_g2_i1:124-1527(-)
MLSCVAWALDLTLIKLAVTNDSKERFAIKILKDELTPFIKNEVQALNAIKHENIINLVDVLQNATYQKKDGKQKKVTAIVLELAPGGEVFDFLYNTGRFSERVARFYFRQLISSLEYIHSQGITHRDLKPENLLFDENYCLKLADFGFSTAISGRDGRGQLQTYLGTKGYMAPEILLKSPYHGPSVDLFAAGVILFVMLSGSPPFNEASPNDPNYKLIVTNKHDSFWHSHSKNRDPSFYSQDFRDLLNFMLAYDPAQRLNLSEIKSHPWVLGDVPSFEEVASELRARHARVLEAAENDKREKKKIAEAKKAQPPAFKEQPAKRNVLMGYTQPKNRSGQLNEVAGDQLIEESFPSLKSDREIVKYEKIEGLRCNDYLYPENIQDSLLSLLYVLRQKCNEINLSDKTYKVVAKVLDEEEGTSIQIKVRLFKEDESSTYIRFEKLEGNVLKFHDVVRFFEKSLDEVSKSN